jgi:hypothetical protein
VIDFELGPMHQGGMRFLKASLPVLLSVVFCSGCIHLGHPLESPEAQKKEKKNLLSRLGNPWIGFHPFSRKAPTPKAVALLTVGTVRTISTDESYVIAEMEPGVMVATGNILLIPENGGGTARLKVAEITPPFFVADVERGHPRTGDLLKQ